MLASSASLTSLLDFLFPFFRAHRLVRYNLSEAARATTRHGSEAVSFACETAVYLYLGLNFAFSFNHLTDSLEWNINFLLVTLFLCLASRGVAVLLLSALFNLFVHPRRRLSFRLQLMVWWSGLRGSVAFALALNAPGKNTPMFLTTTLAIVMITTIVGGGMTERVDTHTHKKRQQNSQQCHVLCLTCFLFASPHLASLCLVSI